MKVVTTTHEMYNLQEKILESAYCVCFTLIQVRLHNKQKLVDNNKNRPWYKKKRETFVL